MFKNIIKQLLAVLLSLLLASLIIFFLVRLSPSDPISLMINEPTGKAIPQEIKDKQIEELKKEYGLDDSIVKQYTHWIKGAFKLEFGYSIVSGEEISSGIKRTIMPSIILALTSVIIEILLSMILAIVSVIYLSKWQDRLIQFMTVLLKSIPYFAVAVLSLQLFSVKLKIYPMTNSTSIDRLWLPVIVIAITQAPKLTRLIRNQIINELGKTYIKDGISKGYSKMKLIKEAIRNSFYPIWTQISLSLAGSIGGLVVTENLFAWPGLGNYGLTAVLRQDYPVVQAYVLLVIFMVMIVHLLTDSIYKILNPNHP